MTMAENSLIGSALVAVIGLAVMIWVPLRIRAVWRGEKPSPNIPLSRKHRYFLGYHVFEVTDRNFPMFGMSVFSMAAFAFFLGCSSLAQITGNSSLDHSLTTLSVFSLVMSFPLIIFAGLIFLVGHPKFLIPPSQRDRDAETAKSERVATDDKSLIDPDGILNDLSTVVVGNTGGFIIGLIESFVVGTLLFFDLGLVVGILVWLGATVYLVQRRTVQEVISKAAYGIAIAILSVPLIVFSPGWGTGKVLNFILLTVICVIPAAIVGGIGLLAARFVPTSSLEG
jgi:F0F1-type ATP synthase assembly protein I